jgi:hypothetical protein
MESEGSCVCLHTPATFLYSKPDTSNELSHIILCLHYPFLYAVVLKWFIPVRFPNKHLSELFISAYYVTDSANFIVFDFATLTILCEFYEASQFKISSKLMFLLPP